MEPQVTICCHTRRNNRRCCYIWLIIGILAIILAFTIGLVIGALARNLILMSLPAIIVFIVILIILIIIEIIRLLCNRERRCSDRDRRCCDR